MGLRRTFGGGHETASQRGVRGVLEVTELCWCLTMSAPVPAYEGASHQLNPTREAPKLRGQRVGMEKSTKYQQCREERGPPHLTLQQVSMGTRGGHPKSIHRQGTSQDREKAGASGARPHSTFTVPMCSTRSALWKLHLRNGKRGPGAFLSCPLLAL